MKNFFRKKRNPAGAGQKGAAMRQITLGRKILNARSLYILLSIPFVYVLIFNYVPIYGVIIAFKRFSPRRGIWGSEWVGWYNFQRFFDSPNFLLILRNTLVLSIYNLLAGFPLPIIMAICVNHCFIFRLKKAVQTITFAPYFLSAVILVGFITQLLAMRTGGVNFILKAIGLKEINFLGSASLFPHVYVWSQVWKTCGYSAIIYISSLAAVDPTYHEAAVIDGANLWQRVWHIDLATIRPIIIIMIILSMGNILGGDFETTYLLQNPLNINTSEIIATYVYKVGLGANISTVSGLRSDYSFGAAIGLFQNVVGVALTLLVNRIANRISGEGMF
jgi:multiple sugar transport system permease protein/putative aldouronate transport system permease protein